jgi:hypothetical protein
LSLDYFSRYWNCPSELTALFGVELSFFNIGVEKIVVFH